MRYESMNICLRALLHMTLDIYGPTAVSLHKKMKLSRDIIYMSSS